MKLQFKWIKNENKANIIEEINNEIIELKYLIDNNKERLLSKYKQADVVRNLINTFILNLFMLKVQ